MGANPGTIQHIFDLLIKGLKSHKLDMMNLRGRPNCNEKHKGLTFMLHHRLQCRNAFSRDFLDLPYVQGVQKYFAQGRSQTG